MPTLEWLSAVQKVMNVLRLRGAVRGSLTGPREDLWWSSVMVTQKESKSLWHVFDVIDRDVLLVRRPQVKMHLL